MQCGLFHDVGKLNFMNLYSHMARQWFEDEYEMARLHTIVGGNHLEERSSTRRYAAAARGHHSWYDGSRREQEQEPYRRLKCASRQMVDVISLIDWLDNVTCADRIYIGVEKTWEEAVKDAIDLEGRRFSPLLTAWLRDKNVSEELRHILTEERTEAYRQLYEEERAWKDL